MCRWLGICRAAFQAVALTKPTPHALFARLTSTLNRLPEQPKNAYASLSLPYLRRPARGRYRQGRALVRLVPPHPRPWRGAVHRPARPLRAYPSGGRPRQQGVQAGRDPALGMGGAHRRQGAPAPGRHREPRTADRPGRGLYRRDRGAGTRRRTADAGVRRAGVSGRDPAQIPLPRPAPRQAAPQHHAARRRSSIRCAPA